MASTITIAQSIGWISSYVGFKQLAIGASSEPAITAANIIQQTILSPPFSWNWNRNSFSFTTVAGTQDYPQSVPSFGFIEKAAYVANATVTATVLNNNVATYTAANGFQINQNVVVTGTTNGGGIFNVVNQPIVAANGTSFQVQINNANIASAVESGAALAGGTKEIPNITNILGVGAERGEPNFFAPQQDNNAGTIVFRILPVPDQSYIVTETHQNRITTLITATGNTWSPIPDHYAYIYQWGFGALMLAYQDDPKWTSFSQKFVASLLGVAEGISEEAKNVFQAAWLSSITEMQVTGQKAQQGVSARAV